MGMRGPKPKPIAERFWPKVDKRGPDECWPWKAGRNKREIDDYGVFAIRHGEITTAHRVAYMLTHDNFDESLYVLHTCDFKPCCNPAHLVAGTQKENILDASKKGLLKKVHGEQHGRAILTESQVKEIISITKSASDTGLSERFGISRSVIQSIRHNRTWRHIPR